MTHPALRWGLVAAGLILLPVAAWMCSRSFGWLLLFVPLYMLWGLWLTIEYMRWYKTLGK